MSGMIYDYILYGGEDTFRFRKKIKRYCKEAKQKVEFNYPQVVKEYNKHIGGVDLANMLISLYRTPFKIRRCYISIFAQLLDICINNAWLSYRNDCTKIKKAIPLKVFRYEIYEGLKKNRRSVIDPLDSKRGHSQFPLSPLDLTMWGIS